MDVNQEYNRYFPGGNAGNPVNPFPLNNGIGLRHVTDTRTQNVNYGTSFHFGFKEPGQYNVNVFRGLEVQSESFQQQATTHQAKSFNTTTQMQQKSPETQGVSIQCQYQHSKLTLSQPNTGSQINHAAFSLAPTAPLFGNSFDMQKNHCRQNYRPNSEVNQAPRISSCASVYSSDCSSLSGPWTPPQFCTSTDMAKLTNVQKDSLSSRKQHPISSQHSNSFPSPAAPLDLSLNKKLDYWFKTQPSHKISAFHQAGEAPMIFSEPLFGNTYLGGYEHHANSNCGKCGPNE